MLTLHEDSESSNLECDNCDSGDLPMNRCTTCSHFLCEFCTQAHQRGRNSRSHNLISLEEAKKMGSVAVTKPSICKEHEGEVIKLFCETCEEAICRDCTIVKHRNHKYTFVKDAFSKGKESLLKILSETKTKTSLLKEAVNGVMEMKKNVHASAEQTAQEIINCFNELSACLDARRGQLVDKVEEFKKAKLKSLEIQQEELETALGSIQSSVEFTERAFENGSEVEILNMRKQMSKRLQDLNSAKWQLEPCVDGGLKFKSGNQLKNEIARHGVVTDVVTFAGTSTVTMGNGQEGVMYNTLSGQQIEFIVTAKERNGRKRMEGGDKVLFDVTEPNTCRPLVELSDKGSGTYSLSSVLKANWKFSAKLNGYHIQGSPFTCFAEEWILQLFPSANTQGSIQFSDNNLTAVFYGTMYHQPQYYFTGITVSSQHPGNDVRPCAVGSVGFNAGRHMWKAQLCGKFLQASTFGICSSRGPDGTPGQQGNWWVWNSGKVFKVVNGSQVLANNVSMIDNVITGDIIEFYLDCENGTLKIYNRRTRQSDTLDGVKGDVIPVFRMTNNGDEVSLRI